MEPPKDGSNGYVASKWASEVVLEKAARQAGIPVTVHRTLAASPGKKASETTNDVYMSSENQKQTLDEFILLAK